MKDKRGQLAIIIIIAIVLAAGIVIFFAVRGGIGVGGVSAELRPVFDYYSGCIEQEARMAISLAGSQGGRVDTDSLNYNPGSEYAPFSSELNFLGFPVPYWYYISGNGVAKEQVPSKSEIEREIGDYIGERLDDCDFDIFYSQGFNISVGEVEVDVNIEDEEVNVIVNSGLVVNKGEERAVMSNYEVSIDSKLGKFYDIALDIYSEEKINSIFDNYGADVLRLYAPVDGVAVSCSGEIWKTREVVDNLKSGLEANIGAIKFQGNYYSLNEETDDYFVVDLGNEVDENVNLIYSRNMPTKIEVSGDGVNDELMIASPVGIQEGLGILGFCYAPYHFVYDLSFPVMVQIYDNTEMFQFPIVAVIDNNVVREARETVDNSDFEYLSEEEFDLCEFKTQSIEVNLFDINLNRINGNISYQCFDQRCRLGESAGGRFVGSVPGCLNGQLLVSAEGYANKQQTFSSNQERIADVILEREHEVKIDLRTGGRELGGNTAIVSFAKKDGSKVVSTALPDGNGIKLSEGNYDVTVYVYGDSSLKIPGSTKNQCAEVPKAGILGFFGGTKEECFDITIPETEVDFALVGGGKGEVYLLESMIEDGAIVIDVPSLPTPKSLEELQNNYASFERSKVVVL